MGAPLHANGLVVLNQQVYSNRGFLESHSIDPTSGL